MIKPSNLVTRSQLKGYGASPYHANIITQHLIPVMKQGRANAYAINDVIASLRDYLKRPRLKKQSRKTLKWILETLLERLGNIIEVPFSEKNSTYPKISQLAKQLTQAIAETDKNLAQLKATVATIKGKDIK